MIRKVVKKARLSEFSEIQENLAYWMSKTSAERVEAVAELRRQCLGDTSRFQRVARIVKRGER